MLIPSATQGYVPASPVESRNAKDSATQSGPADQAATERPYLLSRLYEGRKPFHEEDQDTLSTVFRPLIRMPVDPALQLDRMQKVGEPPKSIGLGFFVDPASGTKYYIKNSPDPDKARNEVLFSDLARHFGLDVPRVQTLEHEGKTYVATVVFDDVQMANVMFPNCAIDPRELVKIPKACPDIGKALVAAALLNNRDIIGIGCDNVGFRTLPDGSLSPVFIDFGGSGEYRATSGTKTFDAKALEFSTMTEPTLQAGCNGGGPNGLVFGNTPQSVLQESIDKVIAVPDAVIKDEIARTIANPQTGSRIFDTLIQRREAIRKQIESGAPNCFQEKLEGTVSYGVTCAYGWDDEDPEITTQVRSQLAPAVAAYVADNLHLLADGEGHMAVCAHVKALATPLVDRLWADKNPGLSRAKRS